MKVSSLTIEMAANVARLQKDMDQARRVVESTMGRVSATASIAAKALGLLGVAGGVSGLVSMARNVGQTAREIERLSAVANADAQTLQKWGYATQTVGMNQEKLSDVLKDVTDKVGEFLSTGGGPMKDFFEQIAPKVGVSADMFRKLSGPESLQLYVSSLEKAGVGQKEATFYMEALANDATALLPLLKRNGAAMNALASEAVNMGLVMSEQAVAQAKELARQTEILDARLAGVRNTISTALLPVVAEMASQMNRASEGTRSFSESVGKGLAEVLGGAIIAGRSFVLTFQLVVDTIGASMAALERYNAWDFKGAKAVGDAWRAEWKQRLQDVDEANRMLQLSTLPRSVVMTDEERRKRGLLPTSSGGFASTPSGPARVSKDAERAAAAELKAQRALYADLLGVSADYVEQLARIQTMRLSGALTDEQANEAATRLIERQREAGAIMEQNARWTEESAKANESAYEEQAKRVEALQEELKAQLQANEAMGLSATALAELEAARQRDTAAELERRAAMMDGIDPSIAGLYRDQAKSLNELAAARVAGATKQVAIDAAKKAEEAWKDTANEISQGLTDALMRGFEGGKSFGQNFTDSLKNMFKTQLARALQESIAKGLASAFSGQSFNWGSLFGGGGQGGINWGDLAQKAYGFFGGGGAGAASAYATYGTSGAYNAAALEVANNAAIQAGASAGTAAASSWMSSASAYAGWVAIALTAADSLYKKGYTRSTLTGEGQASTSDQYAGIANSMRPSASAMYKMSLEGLNYNIMKSTGVTGKWTEIMTGTVRMAHWFGLRLKEYGYQVDIAAGEVQKAREFAFYKGGLFRSDKTRTQASDSAGAQAWEAAVRDMQSSTAALAVALGGSRYAVDNYTGAVRVNLRGVTNAAEEQQRYSEALQEGQRQMINAATGAEYSKEQFASMMADIEKSMVDVGISSRGIADILVDGIMGRMSQAEVGAALSDMIIGGIYESIASSYAGQIASVFTGQILTPMFAAMAAGVPVSQAISQQAIQNVVATAQSAASALNAIFNDAGFRSAIAGIETAIRGVAGAVSKVKVPSFGTARLSAANSAAQKANEIARERYQLETQLAQALGLTSLLRQREMASLDASNRHLQQHIWALEDARSKVESVMATIERSIDAQREALQASMDDVQDRLEAARASERALNDVFDTLRRNILDLRGMLHSTSVMQAAQAQRVISEMMAGTRAVESNALNEAIGVLRSSMDSTIYASRVDRDRAYLRLAADLSVLQSMTEPQLSYSEQQVSLLEEQVTQIEAQLSVLDEQLKVARQQVDALYGIDTSVKGVSAALAELPPAMAEYTSAVQAAMTVSFATGAAPSSSASYGSVSGGGGGVSSPKQWTASGYMSKNPDLQAYWKEHGAELARDRGWTVDDYAKWHWEHFGKDENRKFATGGVFGGGVVMRPSFFDMGQMAERSPEAIMPLARVGGGLGVRAFIGGDPDLKRLAREMVDELRKIAPAAEAAAVQASRTAQTLQRVTRNGTAVAVQPGELAVFPVRDVTP